MFISIAFFAFALSALLIRALLHPSAPLRILDHPNARSLHTAPVPRTGGVAIIVALVVTAAVFGRDEFGPTFAWIAAGGALVGIVSFLDDRFKLSPAFRILVHLAAAGTTVLAGLALSRFELAGITLPLPSAIAAVLTALYVVWMINLYNFMDGMDGFAGGMTLFGFGTFALLGWNADDAVFATASLAVAAAAAGFLLFNFPRPVARIFMGDSGASTLGYVAAVFSLWADRSAIFPLWISVLVFAPFIADATATLMRRLLRGETVWRAHRTHCYQRLVRRGWGHRRTVAAEYALMIAGGGAALIAVRSSSATQMGIALFVVTAYAALWLTVGRTDADDHRSG